jgi:phospholipid/cholesterol/gamma-HCH transport system substrate-binding protein
MLSKSKVAAGAFLIGGLLLFGLGLFLIGDRRMLFSDSVNYHTEFSQVSALEIGGKVRVGGLDAGEILEILVPQEPGAKFRVKFRVVEKFLPVIRTDSVASIATDGLLGNKFLAIDIGMAGPAPPDSALPSREPFEIGDLLARIRETVAGIDKTFGDVKGDISEATKTVAESARHIDEIIVATQEPIGKVTAAASRISEDLSVLIARVRSGEGTLGKLVNDDTVYRSLSASSQEVERVMGNLRQTSADAKDLVSKFKNSDIPDDLEETVRNVREGSERIKSLIATFQPGPGGGDGMAGDLRATLSGAREAMGDLAENLEAMKHGFFFRGFFKDRGFYDLASLSPAEYQSKNFEKSVTKERVWVQGDQLFTVDGSGTEVFSDSGKKKIDSMMANFLRFTNDRAVIVEGYAAAGSAEEQFLLSRERAVKVRDYLINKFAINPEYIGVMPMAGASGDGIALVLLKK